MSLLAKVDAHVQAAHEEAENTLTRTFRNVSDKTILNWASEIKLTYKNFGRTYDIAYVKNILGKEREIHSPTLSSIFGKKLLLTPAKETVLNNPGFQELEKRFKDVNLSLKPQHIFDDKIRIELTPI